MQQQHSKNENFLLSIGLVALATALGLALAPAAGAEMWTWRTDDGGYAYTDDPDRVPARYALEAQVVAGRDLDDYERYTPQDDAASAEYATRLAQRLQYLRALNGGGQGTALPQTAATAAPARTISLSTGDERAPQLNVPVGAGQGPIVIEPVAAKRSGDIITRHVTVVRQGDETLAVIKGAPRQTNPVDDIHEEEDLEAGLPLR